jgi:putative tryptophan/tyrosine transport system substrate-binding protein
MRRREFIAGLGSAAAWPMMARAQQGQRMRRIGFLMNLAADDAVMPTRLATFEHSLQELGWTVGRNIQIDYRFTSADPDLSRKYAAELVALAPDVILAQSGLSLGPLLQATRTLPIVFTNVTDPVGAGFVDSLARPGRNATGFMNLEFRIAGKWLELLKQIAPSVTRVAVLRDTQGSGPAMFGVLQAVAQSLKVEVNPVNTSDAGEIERGIAALALAPNGGLVVTASTSAIIRRDLIIALAARHKLPAVYSYRYFVTDGGPMSYGVDPLMPYRLASTYIDRILKDEKPADLPVQAPTKYETAINLKTAKALGLTIPETLLATADEVIQ